MTRPGPHAPEARPRRNSTTRWYSRTIFTPVTTPARTATMTTAKAIRTAIMFAPSQSRDSIGPARCRPRTRRPGEPRPRVRHGRRSYRQPPAQRSRRPGLTRHSDHADRRKGRHRRPRFAVRPRGARRRSPQPELQRRRPDAEAGRGRGRAEGHQPPRHLLVGARHRNGPEHGEHQGRQGHEPGVAPGVRTEQPGRGQHQDQHGAGQPAPIRDGPDRSQPEADATERHQYRDQEHRPPDPPPGPHLVSPAPSSGHSHGRNRHGRNRTAAGDRDRRGRSSRGLPSWNRMTSSRTWPTRTRRG